MAPRSPATSGRRFDGALIDLFGTLIPAAPRVSRAPHLHEMARILGADPTTFEREWAGSFADRVLGRLGPLDATIRHLAGRQGIYPTDDEVGRALATRLAFTRQLFEACGPVLPSLDALRDAGIRLSVVSDTSDETPRLWDSTPLAQRVDATVFSCQEGCCKPDPRMYRLGLQRLGLPAERCAYVGDGGSRELTGAESEGLSAFMYRFPGATDGPDARYDPDVEWRGTTLRDLGELITPRG
jgi:putative hydrolase of the HAD superfamily